MSYNTDAKGSDESTLRSAIAECEADIARLKKYKSTIRPAFLSHRKRTANPMSDEQFEKFVTDHEKEEQDKIDMYAGLIARWTDQLAAFAA